MENLKSTSAKGKIYIMVGCPGSGKSTFLTKKELLNHTISRDEVRFSLLKEGDEYFSKEKEVWESFIYQICAKIVHSFMGVVCIDATHLNAKSRAKLVDAIKKTLPGVEKDWDFIPICFNVPFETCVERNEKRGGRAFVPYTAMKNMYNSLTFPAPEEGFKEYYIVNKEGEVTNHRYFEDIRN